MLTTKDCSFSSLESGGQNTNEAILTNRIHIFYSIQRSWTGGGVGVSATLWKFLNLFDIRLVSLTISCPRDTSLMTAKDSSLFETNMTLQNILNSIQYSWSDCLIGEINLLLGYLRPSRSTLLRQRLLIDQVVSSLFRHLGTIAIPVDGASLSGEKIQLTLVLPLTKNAQHEGKWRLKVHEAVEAMQEFPQQLQSLRIDCVSSTTLLTFQHDEVEISLNNASSIYFSALFDDIEEIIVGGSGSGTRGLMKASYFFIKSWLKNSAFLGTGLSSVSIHSFNISRNS